MSSGGEREEAVPVSEPTYINPVHSGYLGDPFVLKNNGEYYGYGTTPVAEKLAIPVLHSRDLVSWRPLGEALSSSDGTFEEFWAPEEPTTAAHSTCTTPRAAVRGRATGCA